MDDPPGPGERYGSFTAGLDDCAASTSTTARRVVSRSTSRRSAPAHCSASRCTSSPGASSRSELARCHGGLLVEQLECASDWEQRFALLDGLVTRSAERASVPRPDVASPWRRLEQTDGVLWVSELARELGCSLAFAGYAVDGSPATEADGAQPQPRLTVSSEIMRRCAVCGRTQACFRSTARLRGDDDLRRADRLP